MANKLIWFFRHHPAGPKITKKDTGNKGWTGRGGGVEGSGEGALPRPQKKYILYLKMATLSTNSGRYSVQFSCTFSMQVKLKGDSRLKYSFKWTFMFNKVAYTAWKWQFMFNKYVWRFNCRTHTTVVYTECLRSVWDTPTIEYAIAFAKKSLNDRNKQVKFEN